MAIDEPQIRPSAAHAPTVAWQRAAKARESAFAAWNSSRDMRGGEGTAPMRMKSGMTDSEYAVASWNGTEHLQRPSASRPRRSRGNRRWRGRPRSARAGRAGEQRRPRPSDADQADRSFRVGAPERDRVAPAWRAPAAMPKTTQLHRGSWAARDPRSRRRTCIASREPQPDCHAISRQHRDRGARRELEQGHRRGRQPVDHVDDRCSSRRKTAGRRRRTCRRAQLDQLEGAVDRVRAERAQRDVGDRQQHHRREEGSCDHRPRSHRMAGFSARAVGELRSGPGFAQFLEVLRVLGVLRRGTAHLCARAGRPLSSSSLSW